MTTAVKSAGECNNEILEFDNSLSAGECNNETLEFDNSLSEYTPLITKYNVPQELPNGGDAGVYVGKTKRYNVIAFVILLTLSATNLAMSVYLVLIQGKVNNVTLADLCAAGLKNRKISHASFHYGKSTGAELARLDENTEDGNKWIQIDIGKMEEIAGVVTQGSPSGAVWTTSYSVSCGDSEAKFVDLNEFTPTTPRIFPANYDQNTSVVNFFANVIQCQYLRIHPKTWKGSACMRLEAVRGNCSYPNRFKFYTESGGWYDGNTCKLEVNGIDYAHHKRGHNILTLDPETTTITVDSFDTYDAYVQSDLMANFIERAPYYSIVTIAVQDSGRYMSGKGDSALRQLGAGGSGCPTYIDNRDSWAFISQKVRPGESLPSWIQCQYRPSEHGMTRVSVSLTLSAHYPSLDDSPIGRKGV